MKRSLSLVLALMLLFSLTAVSSAFAQEAPVTVTFQTWNPGEGSKIKDIIADFEAENPDIHVEYICMPYSDHLADLQVKLFSSEGPDVYGMNAGAPYATFRDFEVELSELAAAADGENWKDVYLPFCLNLLESDGQYYGLPLGLTYAGFLWADMNYFTKYNLELPASYDELKTVAAAFRQNGELPLLIGAKDSWINTDTFINIAGDTGAEVLYSAIEGQASWESPELVSAFSIWQHCFTDGVFQDGALGVNVYNDAWDMFGTSAKAPMMVNGSWVMDSYLNSDPAMQAVFCGENSDHRPFLIDWNNDGKLSGLAASIDVVLCLNTNSQHKEEAFRWMNYLASKGQDVLINQSMSYCPTRTDIELNVQGLNENGMENLDYIVKTAETEIRGIRTIPYADLDQQLAECLSALATGEMTPEQAAQAMEAVSAAIER